MYTYKQPALYVPGLLNVLKCEFFLLFISTVQKLVQYIVLASKTGLPCCVCVRGGGGGRAGFQHTGVLPAQVKV